MTGFVTTLLMLAITAPPPAAEICQWMSGAQVDNVEAHFANAQAAVASGDFGHALDGFLARCNQLSSEAQKACFDAGESDLKQTAAFLDKRVRGERPVLIPRRDVFALPVATSSWAAYLACRAGRTASGLVLLRAQWRDWAAETVRDDMAFLVLASASPDQAAGTVLDAPDTVNAMVAKGLFHCRLGEAKAGMAWLVQAHGKAADEMVAERISGLMNGWCK